MTFSKIIVYIRPRWQVRLQDMVLVVSYVIKQSGKTLATDVSAYFDAFLSFWRATNCMNGM